MQNKLDFIGLANRMKSIVPKILTERSYRKLLWNHTPLTDFWRIGNGYAKKLMENGMFTMGMGPTTIAEIRAYKPQNNSVSSRQVLHCPIQQRKQSLL